VRYPRPPGSTGHPLKTDNLTEVRLTQQIPELPASESLTSSAPATRQRLLHPPTRTRLRLRGHLRDLHLLPDQHRVPAHPATPARPRPPSTTNPTAPPCSTGSSPASTRRHHDQLDSDYLHSAETSTSRHSRRCQHARCLRPAVTLAKPDRTSYSASWVAQSDLQPLPTRSFVHDPESGQRGLPRRR
jgi:hypothetical protein